MKRSLKTMAVVMAIVMSLAVAQVVCAETVTGTITDLNTAEQWVELDDNIIISCISFNYLAKKGIYPVDGDSVTIEYTVRICPDGTTKNCAVTYNEIALPGARGKK